MKILYSDDGKTIAIVVDLKEGKDLADAMTCVSEKDVPKPRKNSRVWKIAEKLSNDLAVW